MGRQTRIQTMLNSILRSAGGILSAAKNPDFKCLGKEIGGAERDRTAGLLVANEALSQLSYSPTDDSLILSVMPFSLKGGLHP
jgi:hypothetical protein